ncbi:hypothetical protein B0H11DRAFT_2430118 [Mycena galericulata]|nr:hypothetical protein B0H11DRAFT_2430118 [Mycena galericulata]
MSSHKLHTPVAIDFHLQELILGLTIPGMVLTGLVLLAFGYTARNLNSRPHLNRVSFRLLVYAMISNFFSSLGFLIHPEGPSPGCTFIAFFSTSSLLFGACMFFCIALNLQLVLVHRINGQMMEKYYLIGSSVLVAVPNITALIAGEFGYFAENKTCWFCDPDPAEKLRWLVGTQLVWLLAMASLEFIFFLILVVFMIRHQRTISDIGRTSTSTPQSPAPIVKYRGMILRIGLYPLLSCFLNFSGSISNLIVLKIPAHTELTWRLNLFTVCVYAIRPFFYACIASTDPSLLRAVRALPTAAGDSSSSSRPNSWVSSVVWRNSTGMRNKRSFSFDTKAIVRVECDRVTDSKDEDRNRDSTATVTAAEGTEMQETQTESSIQIPGSSIEVRKEEDLAEAEVGGDEEQGLQPRTPEQGWRPTQSIMRYVPMPPSDGIECQN